MNFPISRRSVQRSLVCGGVFVLAACAANGQASLKSGPKTGELMPGLFYSLIVNGTYAGQSKCLVHRVRGGWISYPALPYGLVFVRTADDRTFELIRKLDDEAALSKKFRVGVVFLSDDPEIEGRLKKIVEKEKFRAVIVSTYAAEGPSRWSLAKEAEVTVAFLSVRHVVEANFAFRKGEPGPAQMGKILQAAKALQEKH